MTRIYKFLTAAMVALVLTQPSFGQNGAASQIGNNAFDSLNRALRVDAVATGGGGSSSSTFLNLDQLLSSVYDSTHNALKVNIVSGLPCTVNASGAIACTATGTNQDITLTPSGTGLTSVTNFADKGGQVFNVKAYGAKGDGTTDDSAAINEAYQAATAVKGTVYFPCGTYKITSAIADSGPVSWQGENRGCVTLQIPAASAFDVFDVTSGNVSFKNLTIDANGSSSASYGVLMTGAPLDHITFDHVTVENAGGWCASWGNSTASAVSDLLVTNSTFTGCGAPSFGGITTGSVSASNMQFSNDIFGDTAYPRTLLTSQAHVSLYIANNTDTGSFSNIVIDNCVIEYPILGPSGGTQQESDGVVLIGGGNSANGTLTNFTLSNNLIYGTPGVSPTNSHAIELVGADYGTVSNNVVENAKNALFAQIGANGNVNHLTVASNIVSNTSGATGLMIQPYVAATISGNYVSSLLTVQMNGSNQVLEGNTLNSVATSGPVVQFTCQESATCTGVSINSNNVSTANNLVGIKGSPVSGKPGFSGLSIQNNTIKVGVSGWGYEEDSGLVAAGLISGNTNSGTAHLYAIRSSLILNAVTGAPPSGSCNSGSKWVNTAGGSGTTFYGCEAGAWAAK